MSDPSDSEIRQVGSEILRFKDRGQCELKLYDFFWPIDLVERDRIAALSPLVRQAISEHYLNYVNTRGLPTHRELKTL
jgi:hypothetical protein